MEQADRQQQKESLNAPLGWYCVRHSPPGNKPSFV